MQLVGDEPVAEGRVFMVDVVGGVAPAQLPQLGIGVLATATAVARGRRGEAVLAVGNQPAVQTGLGDPEVFGHLGDRCLALAGHRDHVSTQLRRIPLGTILILPSRPRPHR
jgi:hypothetical protein